MKFHHEIKRSNSKKDLFARLRNNFVYRGIVANLLAVLALNFAGSVLSAQANPTQAHVEIPTRAPEFRVPAQLRPRVDFWKDIYARYGKYQVVIHHRNFPQMVFKVLDFSQQGLELGDIAFDAYKKRQVDQEVKEVREAIKWLSSGADPRNDLDMLVQRVMLPLPGGLKKYKEALDDDLVRSQTGIKERFGEAIQRSGRYLPMIERIFVREFGLPIEITRLPFVESSFDYTAYSSAGAAGIWQFMPRTAKPYMSVGKVVDERRDPLKSSQAAARYLLDAYRRIGNWPLTIISYNHGVGGVLKKMRDTGTSDIVTLIEAKNDRPFGFASSNFYPCFLAALEVYEERHIIFPGVPDEAPLRYVEHQLSRPVSANYAARQLGVSVETLQRANYALLDRVWSGKSPIPAGYSLKVPVEASAALANLRVPEQQVQAVAPPASSVYGGLVYKVRKGDTLSGIAKKYGVSVAQLRFQNGISGNAVRVGQNLVVKQKETERSREARVEQTDSGTLKKTTNNIPSEAPSSTSTDLYVVRPGDTLYSIARQNATSIESLKQLNGLSASRLHVGQKIKISQSSENRKPAEKADNFAKNETSTEKDSSSRNSNHSSKVVRVEKGESLWTLSKRTGASVSEIRRLNGLKNDSIRAGQVLVIP